MLSCNTYISQIGSSKDAISFQDYTCCFVVVAVYNLSVTSMHALLKLGSYSSTSVCQYTVKAELLP